MCGEMAGEPLFALVLLGLQLDDLSMNAASLPLVKRALRSVTAADANALIEHVLTLASAEEVAAVVNERMRELVGKNPVDGARPGTSD